MHTPATKRTKGLVMIVACAEEDSSSGAVRKTDTKQVKKFSELHV